MTREMTKKSKVHNNMKAREERKQEINKMVIELEEMEKKAYDSTLSRNNVDIYGIIVKNLATMRCLQSKYNGLIMGYSKVFIDTYNDIEDLYKQSKKVIKKLK